VLPPYSKYCLPETGIEPLAPQQRIIIFALYFYLDIELFIKIWVIMTRLGEKVKKYLMTLLSYKEALN
jgi:hypothetical protein